MLETAPAAVDQLSEAVQLLNLWSLVPPGARKAFTQQLMRQGIKPAKILQQLVRQISGLKRTISLKLIAKLSRQKRAFSSDTDAKRGQRQQPPQTLQSPFIPLCPGREMPSHTRRN
jgi:hypothetical protein